MAGTTDVVTHRVAYYDRDDDLVALVAPFLAEAFDDDGAAIVIATPAHRSAIGAELASSGLQLASLVGSGRYVDLDARHALAGFMQAGVPDAARFDRTVGAIVRNTYEAHGRVLAFGEMVALLWDDGNVNAAIELEALWNELLAGVDASLYCAYRIADAYSDLAGTHRVCAQHQSIDVLGNASSTSVTDAGSASASFLPAPEILRQVRGFVSETLTRWHLERLVDDALVVVSELATNAIRHAHSPFVVNMANTEASVNIDVRDFASNVELQPRDRGRSTGGYGLGLVAKLADSWGWSHGHDSKTVWASLISER